MAAISACSASIGGARKFPVCPYPGCGNDAALAEGKSIVRALSRTNNYSSPVGAVMNKQAVCLLIHRISKLVLVKIKFWCMKG